MSSSDAVQAHYTSPEMPTRIEEALTRAGLGAGPLDWSALAPLDQFHVRGLAASRELAEGLGVTGGEHVLDIGSGLGGPARYLAAVHGCTVTGIELTPLFVQIAGELSRRTGLADRVGFVQGDALALPFPPESFDHAWTQHVAMNIEDKAGLYRGIFRVLNPGGRLALYDVLLGENGSPVYPLPWAGDARISFLASPAELAGDLRAAGFREVSTVDTTDRATAWFGEVQATQPISGSAAPLTLGNVVGPAFGPATANLARNLREGRLRLMQVVVQKD